MSVSRPPTPPLSSIPGGIDPSAPSAPDLPAADESKDDEVELTYLEKISVHQILLTDLAPVFLQEFYSTWKLVKPVKYDDFDTALTTSDGIQFMYMRQDDFSFLPELAANKTSLQKIIKNHYNYLLAGLLLANEEVFAAFIKKMSGQWGYSQAQKIFQKMLSEPKYPSAGLSDVLPDSDDKSLLQNVHAIDLFLHFPEALASLYPNFGTAAQFLRNTITNTLNDEEKHSEELEFSAHDKAIAYRVIHQNITEAALKFINHENKFSQLVESFVTVIQKSPVIKMIFNNLDEFAEIKNYRHKKEKIQKLIQDHIAQIIEILNLADEAHFVAFVNQAATQWGSTAALKTLLRTVCDSQTYPTPNLSQLMLDSNNKDFIKKFRAIDILFHIPADPLKTCDLFLNAKQKVQHSIAGYLSDTLNLKPKSAAPSAKPVSAQDLPFFNQSNTASKESKGFFGFESIINTGNNFKNEIIAENKKATNVLFRAIMNHDFETCGQLLQKQPNLVHYEDTHGSNALHLLCVISQKDNEADLKIARLLIANHIDINKTNHYGMTPAHALTVNKDCNVKIMELLIQSGISLSH